MDAFPRNRYDASEFLRGFESACIGHDSNEVWISLAICDSGNNKMEIEIYFPSWADNPPPELLQIARRTCSCITQLDNLVQDSCEDDWRHSGKDTASWELFLANIEIETDLVRLEYYGTKVNTQWCAEFVPSEHEAWAKVNF